MWTSFGKKLVTLKVTTNMSKLVENACLWWKKLNFHFLISLFSGIAGIQPELSYFPGVSDSFRSGKFEICFLMLKNALVFSSYHVFQDVAILEFRVWWGHSTKTQFLGPSPQEETECKNKRQISALIHQHKPPEGSGLYGGEINLATSYLTELQAANLAGKWNM